MPAGCWPVCGPRGRCCLSADDAHAVIEWAGQPSQPAVLDMINDRVPFGVLEMNRDGSPTTRTAIST